MGITGTAAVGPAARGDVELVATGDVEVAGISDAVAEGGSVSKGTAVATSVGHSHSLLATAALIETLLDRAVQVRSSIADCQTIATPTAVASITRKLTRTTRRRSIPDERNPGSARLHPP